MLVNLALYWKEMSTSKITCDFQESGLNLREIM